MEKFVIIDGNSLLNRAFYALPPLANFDGEISNGVFGFANMLTKAIVEIKPKYIAVAFDFARKTFRNELYADYKGGRRETPEELRSQFPLLKKMLKTMNITCIEKQGIEADDIIGTLSKKFDGVENIILTGDRDCLQLINHNTKVMFTKKGISEVVMYDEKQLKEDFGLKPSQIIDLKALMGDSSDNIPGISSVGEKTAKTLLEKYFDVDGVYAHVDEIKGKLGEKLVAEKDIAYLCKDLATIRTNFDLPYSQNDFVYSFPYNSETREFFKRYQFNSLLKRQELFVNDATQQELQIEQEKVENLDQVKQIVKKIKQEKIFAIYLKEQLVIAVKDVEYASQFAGDLLSLGLGADDVLNQLKDVLEDEKIKKICFDSKEVMHSLYNRGIRLDGVVFDVVIARYLINSNSKSGVTLEDVINENGLPENLSAYNMFALKEKYYNAMKKLDLVDLYEKVEMPLVKVLFDMEICGFSVDVAELDSLELKYENELEELTHEIYEDAGRKFNINSPKQLAEVLFDDLGLKSFNNKKKSTGADFLNEMINLHPIVSKILRYRLIYKLYATYIKGFKKVINPKTQKIYTVFNQTLTSTGRLSSSEPNLQNIPVRNDEGKMLRKIFVPSHKDGFIISADYNQIELRLMAHFAQDEKLLKAYKAGEDIHTKTASEIFGVAQSMVTPTMRRDAKAINFGIIYGISDYGLSQNIGSSRKSAGEYIKMYFEKYPAVKVFMDSNVEFARKNGYAKTMFNRIRYIPEITNSNYNLRNFGERVAMNMPLQGTASDIIKMAMIEVSDRFKKEKLESKLILQIHDELVVDCVKNELDKVKQILKDSMENVVQLSIKLPVDISVGKNLYEAK